MSDFQVDKKSKYSRHGLRSLEDEIQSIIFSHFSMYKYDWFKNSLILFLHIYDQFIYKI